MLLGAGDRGRMLVRTLASISTSRQPEVLLKFKGGYGMAAFDIHDGVPHVKKKR